MKKSFVFGAALLAAAIFMGTCDMVTNTGNTQEQDGEANYTLDIENGEAMLSETEYVFPAAYPGYEEAAGFEFKIKNNGTRAAENITLGLSGEGAAAFELSAAIEGQKAVVTASFSVSPDVVLEEGAAAFDESDILIERLEAGSALSVTVRPKTGIAGGEYSAAVTLTGPPGTQTKLLNVKFTVSTTPLYGIRLNVGEAYTFTPRKINYGEAELLTVTVKNIGNEGTGDLAIASAGEQAGSFHVNPATIMNIAPGAEADFTVQPVTGLGEGTYNATVKVSGDNEIAVEFPVSFQVFANQIEINTAADLAAIGITSPADGTYILMSDLTLDKWMPLTAEADTEAYDVPAAPFTGVFDGAGHTITVNSFASDVLETGPVIGYIGIFGCIDGGRVENLTVNLNMPEEQAMKAYSDNIRDKNNQYVGGVAGYAVDTEFDRITVLGNIKLSKNDRASIYLGGVAARMVGGSITNSVSEANLTAEQPAISGGSTYVGGLAGYVYAVKLSHSRVSGRISGYSNYSRPHAGGAAGLVSSNSDAWVEDPIPSTIYRIAVTGDIEASTAKVYNSGSYASMSTSAYAGGIAGNGSGEIRECYSTGDVTVITYVTAGGSRIFAGGIAGYAGGTISDCYSRGAITARVESYGNPLTETKIAGGIVGNAVNAVIEKSYSAGIITAAGKAERAHCFTHAGGIAGLMGGSKEETITIKNCAALSPLMNWKYYSDHINILQRIGNRKRGTVKTTIVAVVPYGEEQYPENTHLSNNIANKDMKINYEPSDEQAAKIPAIIFNPGAGTVDGADCDAKPVQTVFSETLDWDFTAIWEMGNDGYPALRWK
jgi:hypothetical protein